MLTKEDAIALCAVGPIARASGVARDVRKDDPYAVYDELAFEVCDGRRPATSWAGSSSASRS